MIEHGGSGGGTAAPLAGKMIAEIFGKEQAKAEVKETD
jgi:hypothetical protein